MKKLRFLNEIYEAERIVKKGNNIIGYIGDKEIFAFRGINDFNKFELLDGATFDPDPEAEKEQRIADVELALADLLGINTAPSQEWKKNLLVRVVQRRMQAEGRTAEEILAGYPALTEEEKKEILQTLS